MEASCVRSRSRFWRLADFASIAVSDTAVTFENPTHDFPQRVMYRRARARFPGRPRRGPTARHRAGRRLSLSPGRMSLNAADARLLLLGATLVSCAAPHRAASPPRDLDAAIRDALAATAAGWNRGDLDQYLSAYTDSVTSAGPDGFVTGKAAAAAVMRSGFWRSGRPTQQLGYDHLVIRPLGADHALVTGRYVLSGGGRPQRTGWFTTVWVRSASGWRMMHDHS